MENHWELGYWWRVPVTMHWSVLVIFPWFYLFMGSLLFALVGTIAYFFLLVVHEFGHVFVARRRKLYVDSVTLRATHGETTLGTYGSHVDQIAIAWGGVGAQALVLLLTLLACRFLWPITPPLLLMFMTPVVIVFTKWNIFLMVMALLPIGPMDGYTAWAVIPLWRQRLRRRWRRKKARPPQERTLTEAERQALEKQSADITADILRKLTEHD